MIKVNSRTATRIVGAVCVMVMLFPALLSAEADWCYEDVAVSGAGSLDVNGQYTFENMFFGKPAYTMGEERAIYWNHPEDRWQIEDMSGPETVYYANDTDTPIPPTTGWYVLDGSLPAPIVVGGQECREAAEPPPIEVTPAGVGDGGEFLDAPLPVDEGEDPPMAGLQPLCGVFEVGETITGGCTICGPNGNPVRTSYIHLFLYSVDLSEVPEALTLLDHWIVRYDRSTGQYTFEVSTDTLAPGYYDIRLAFADGSSHTMRVQITPAEG